MPPRLSSLVAKGIAKECPSGLDQLIQYEVYGGSTAYAMDSDSSDLDVIGFSIPPIDAIFPNLAGMIPGFDDAFSERRLQYMTYHEVHMRDTDAQGGKGREYD